MDEATRLLLDARAGDRKAMAEWVRRSQAEVWRLCAALVDSGDADDLTQETFVRAMGAMARFRADASARTWLLSIARRTCADEIRRRQRRRRFMPRLLEPNWIEADTRADVEDLLVRLDPDRREAFVLTQMLGLSYADAARVCDCPVGTIRSRVARARGDLLEQLDTGEAATS